MGDAPRTVFNSLHTGLVICTGMSNSNYYIPANSRYHLQHTLYFGGHCNIFHSTLRSLLIAFKKGRAALL